MRSDVHHRGEAVIDELTGMLNRRALAHRADELAAVRELTGQPVGLIVAGLDRFQERSTTRSGTPSATRSSGRRLQAPQADAGIRPRLGIGGEEFLGLHWCRAPAEESATLMEELRRTVEQATLKRDRADRQASG